mgnify:CR=1 FL=1
MKSFKNHCFMLTIMALSIFNTNFIHTEGDVEEPTISQSPSKIENEQQYKKYAEKILSIYSKPEEKLSNAHQLLNLDPEKSYSQADIDKAYRRAMLQWHPDKNPSESAREISKAINNAKDLIPTSKNFTEPSESFSPIEWKDTKSESFSPIEWKDTKPEPVDPSQKLISALNDSVRKKLSNNETLKTKINTILDNLTTDQQKDFINSLNILATREPNNSIENLITKAENITKAEFQTNTTDRAKSWWQQKTSKNFADIFKSDKTILKEYIQKIMLHADPESKIITDKVKQAVAKLSRTERMELFNDITHEELDDKALDGRTPERANKIFAGNKQLFSKIIPEHEMLVETINPNPKIVTRQFKLVNMRQVDPNLSLAENAKQIEKAQGLNYNLEHLEENMRQYLKTHPTVRNLQTLLVDATDRKRAQGLKAKSNKISKIFAIPGMKEQFDTLTSKEKDQFITNITQAEIRLKETNRNLAGSGAKVSYAEAKRIFQENAALFEKFIGPKEILAPIESATRNNVSSFTFETIKLSKYTSSELSKLIDSDLNPIAKQLKEEQNLKLTTADIVQELQNYLERTTRREIYKPEKRTQRGKWEVRTNNLADARQ